ncbi:germin-like protein 2 precursor [Panicum miliaceum]|uniref:Germin-like protein 2 n=1 Tax=Panicum miliaceum TaxID=4540 RepID=A0A3L6SF10_PANMI|nr:germin-like protein 2 precursor [Panicum miliaceum]
MVLLPPLLMATDPDPLQDFCVADLSGTPSVNGHPCLPPSSAGDEFLFSTRIASGGDPLANPNGSNVTELDVSE